MDTTREVLTRLLAIAEQEDRTALRGMQTSNARESAWEAGVHDAHSGWVWRLKRELAELGPEF